MVMFVPFLSKTKKDRVEPWVPLVAGSTLSPTEKRLNCAKCGIKLIFPTTVHDTIGGYCGECRYLLRLRAAVSYNLEHRGNPRNNDFRHRLKEEREYFFAKPVAKWYEPEPGHSPLWQEKMAAAESWNRQLS